MKQTLCDRCGVVIPGGYDLRFFDGVTADVDRGVFIKCHAWKGTQESAKGLDLCRRCVGEIVFKATQGILEADRDAYLLLQRRLTEAETAYEEKCQEWHDLFCELSALKCQSRMDIAAAITAERESCALVAEHFYPHDNTCYAIAAAIRARKEEQTP